MARLFYISITFIFLFSCQPEGKSGKENETKSTGTTLKVGTFQSLTGEIIELERFKGKRVFLNFWATWCKPCIKEMPDIETISKTLKQDNYVFLLASDEPIDKIQNFVNKSELDLNFIKFNETLENWNIYSLPTTIIFDTKGNKTKRLVGAYDWSSDKVLGMLKEIE